MRTLEDLESWARARSAEIKIRSDGTCTHVQVLTPVQRREFSGATLAEALTAMEKDYAAKEST